MPDAHDKRRFRFSIRTLLGLTFMVSLTVFAVLEHRERTRLKLRLEQLQREVQVELQAHERRADQYSRALDGQQETIDQYKRRLSTQS
jgi:hypothetical protein